jgi:hypothetical protein
MYKNKTNKNKNTKQNKTKQPTTHVGGFVFYFLGAYSFSIRLLLYTILSVS